MRVGGYEGGCGVHERTRIEAFKRRAGISYDKQLRLINKMLFKTVIPPRI